jgi:endoglucanase
MIQVGNRQRARQAAGRLALLAIVLSGLMAGSARAGAANAGLPAARAGDPLSGLVWGNYSGSLDEVFPAYRATAGEQHALLGEIALAPRMRWFGSWYKSPRQIARQYIANVTHGNRDVLAQMAVFRLVPWEGQACHSLPTAGQQAGYRSWIRGFAAGIRSARVALVLQPDLPFANCIPHHSKLPLRLVAFAARRFSALPHTSVYIDAGASDWASVGRAATLLRAAGVRYARGFALGATHYDSTAHEIAFGKAIVGRLAAAHLSGRHFVINTAQNGRPFTYQQFHGASYDNAPVCTGPSARRCVALGIPPTWQVSDRRWGLSSRLRAAASRYVDGFLWIGRPWLVNQADPFSLSRTVALARSNPF